MQRTLRNKRLKTLLILFLGLGISISSFYYLNYVQIVNNKKLVELAIEDTNKKISKELKKVSLSISSLDLFFRTSTQINRQLFVEFTEPFIGVLPGVKAIEWAPYVLDRDREAYVESLKTEGFETFNIVQANAEKNKFIPAPQKAFYYPVHFIAPASLNKFALGFDLSTDSARWECIQNSIENQKITVSPPLQLFQNDANTRSFLIVKSVRKNQIENGIILGVFNVNDFIQSILKTELNLLEIRVYDKTANYKSMYSNAKGRPLPATSAKPVNEHHNHFEEQIGNRTWAIYYSPNEQILSYPHLPISYACLFFGFLITFLLVIMVRNASNAKIILEQKVANRTQELNEANQQQAVLLKEIHHRVKNNLQVITSLLSLQSINIDDPAIKEIFSISQYRINAMAVLHEELYQSDNLSKIGYAQYLKKLVENLILSIKGSPNQIELQIDVPDNLKLNIDTAIPLGLLINEIVTNALKYGIPNQNKGLVYIKIIPLAYPSFQLLIGDNGIGYSEKINHKTSKSLGLKLIQQLTRQLNGTFEKDNTQKGTHYKLKIQEID